MLLERIEEFKETLEKLKTEAENMSGSIYCLAEALAFVEAIWDGRITFKNSAETGDIMCCVETCSFYFYKGDLNAKEITPENINEKITLVELANMIFYTYLDLNITEGKVGKVKQQIIDKVVLDR